MTRESEKPMKQTGDDMPDPREWAELFANNAWGPGDVRELMARCYLHAASHLAAFSHESVFIGKTTVVMSCVAELKRLAAEIEGKQK